MQERSITRRNSCIIALITDQTKHNYMQNNVHVKRSNNCVYVCLEKTASLNFRMHPPSWKFNCHNSRALFSRNNWKSRVGWKTCDFNYFRLVSSIQKVERKCFIPVPVLKQLADANWFGLSPIIHWVGHLSKRICIQGMKVNENQECASRRAPRIRLFQHQTQSRTQWRFADGTLRVWT